MITKKWRIIAALIIIPIILIMSLWFAFLFTPLIHEQKGYRYLVKPGSSIQLVILDLTNQKIINHPKLFLLLVKLHGNEKNLKAGEYYFQKGTTPSKMLHQLMTGTGVLYHTFTIINGWNFKQLREALDQEDKIHHLTRHWNNAEIMKNLGYPTIDPEGRFFPDTYYFTLNSSDISLLKRAFKAMQNKLNEAWVKRDNALPFRNKEEALIAASIIEKEAYLNEERPIIAGVLINRLKKNMLLQFDPTVIYGLGARFEGKIRKEDLNTRSPYNTYLNKGLPPTPIAMPSLDSIIGVLHPAQTDYFYFVARGDGSHQFSKTLDEHHLAVLEAKKFQPWYFNFDLVKNHLMQVFLGR